MKEMSRGRYQMLLGHMSKMRKAGFTQEEIKADMARFRLRSAVFDGMWAICDKADENRKKMAELQS